MGLVCGMWGRRIEEGGGGGERLKFLGKWKTFTWNVEERNGKRSMYFVCDSNGNWFKDLSFLCYIDVLLSVESKFILVIKVKCYL